MRAGRLNTVDGARARARLECRAAPAGSQAPPGCDSPATARLGVKDAFTSRSRATLTAGALTMMVITLVAALSMEATYGRVIEDPALRAKPWDLRVEPGARANARPSSSSEPARGQPHDARSRPSGHDPRRREIQARALGEGFERFAYAVPDGRMFARPARRSPAAASSSASA